MYFIPISHRRSLRLSERLNIYYLILEKINSFTEEGKYDVANVPGAQIAQIYEEKRSDAWSTIEGLNITKRIISVCASPERSYHLSVCIGPTLILRICHIYAAKIVQANRSQSNIGRAGTSTSATSSASRFPASRTPSSSSASFKKSPPPPPGASSHADPPPSYTPSPHGNGTTASAAAKRPPPPPPALKPKPRPSVQHVIALYDFAAQVRVISLSHLNGLI